MCWLRSPSDKETWCRNIWTSHRLKNVSSFLQRLSYSKLPRFLQYLIDSSTSHIPPYIYRETRTVYFITYISQVSLYDCSALGASSVLSTFPTSTLLCSSFFLPGSPVENVFCAVLHLLNHRFHNCFQAKKLEQATPTLISILAANSARAQFEEDSKPVRAARR